MSEGALGPKSRPLIEWLVERHPDTPKTRAKQWILAGRVSVAGQVIRKPHQVLQDPGGTLELLERHLTTLDCGSGWQIHPRVSLLYLDRALAVVNKGAGLVSVPAPNAEISALSVLQDFLAGQLKAMDRTARGKSLPAAYRSLHLLPVHRLDQYTSGVFCMACNPESRAHLIEQLKTHTMRREYVAFVEGRAKTPTGTWRQWLDLGPDKLRQRIVPESQTKDPLSEAREAITHYEVIAEYQVGEKTGFVTKLRLHLETGRKHQIRIQAASAGLPLIGDRTYHPGYRPGVAHESIIDFPRQALHAEQLSLEHPEKPGSRMTWKAEWPKDLRQLEATLRSRQV